MKSLAGAAVPAAEVEPDRAGGRPGLDRRRGRRPAPSARQGRPGAGRRCRRPGDPDADAATLTEAARPRRPAGTRRPPQPGVAPVHLVSRQAIDRAAAGRGARGLLGRRPARQPVSTLGRRRAAAGSAASCGSGTAVLEVDPDAEALPRRLRRGAARPAGSPSGTPSCSSVAAVLRWPAGLLGAAVLLAGCGTPRRRPPRPPTSDAVGRVIVRRGRAAELHRSSPPATC